MITFSPSTLVTTWFALLSVVPATAMAQPASGAIGRLPPMLYLRNITEAQVSRNTTDQRALVKNLEALKAANAKPYQSASSPAATKAATDAFLKQNAQELGLANNAIEFQIQPPRKTLTGSYVDVEQRFNGLRVIDGQIQVTVSEDGNVQAVSRNVVTVPQTKAATVKKVAALSDSAARDIAWTDLGASGALLEAPSIERAYVNESNVLTLVHLVRLAVAQPFGYWEYTIDSSTGRIVAKRDRRVKETKSTGRELTIDATTVVGAAPIRFDNALKTLNERIKMQIAQQSANKAAPFTTASAVVFVPNPVSTLNDASLRDGDAAARFANAYAKVTLEGIRKVNGNLTLDGELVRIEDFEPGEGGRSVAPSTAVTEWTARRGDNSFNDAMTYYHIHRNLMYLRSLGYVGAADLFPKGIAVDTDGVGGDDNSHYVPGSDRLAFGHGCVDDNEDTDVILHELGHAITQHISPNWSGGDSRAVGEGFGDYWAVSHRVRMKNGEAVDSGKVFIWDGIDGCWSGRRVDRITARYDPNITYVDHQRFEGFVSDELWSTPLIMALRELVALQETHESVDQVVLEGMAAIGPNFTMRTLALKTVEQARHMFPQKPHATVLEKHFRTAGIIQ